VGLFLLGSAPERVFLRGGGIGYSIVRKACHVPYGICLPLLHKCEANMFDVHGAVHRNIFL